MPDNPMANPCLVASDTKGLMGKSCSILDQLMKLSLSSRSVKIKIHSSLDGQTPTTVSVKSRNHGHNLTVWYSDMLPHLVIYRVEIQ